MASNKDQGTKVVYHLGEEATPYLTKLNIPPNVATLKDLKDALGKHCHKFFFKSTDADFGVVKEELADDDAKLPLFSDSVVTWVVSPEDGQSQAGSTRTLERAGSKAGQPTKNRNSQYLEDLETHDRFDEAALGKGPRHSSRLDGKYTSQAPYRGGVTSSEYDTTSFYSETDASSRYTSMSESTGVSSVYARHRNRKQRRRRPPRSSEASSFSSVTDSTMSLNVITVLLSMDRVSFLGISIVGQANDKTGDGGIYVGSIMKGGAVALDGRIEPGDMILEVNGMSFEGLSNDEAVRVLRDSVQTTGPITLVVAKCWDSTPKDYFSIPQQEPVRPIDPSAWVAHTTALQQQEHLLRAAQLSSSLDSLSTLTESTLQAPPSVDLTKLTLRSPIELIMLAMARPETGLEIRDRVWLKISIPNAFIGSDLVDWLYQNVEGFEDRREARRFASRLLKSGAIRHTVNKSSFSEQCYYTLAEIPSAPVQSHPITQRLEALNLAATPGVIPHGSRAPDQLAAPTYWSNTLQSGYSGITSASQYPLLADRNSPPYYTNAARTVENTTNFSQHSSGLGCLCLKLLTGSYRLPPGDVPRGESPAPLPAFTWPESSTCSTCTSSCTSCTCSQCKRQSKFSLGLSEHSQWWWDETNEGSESISSSNNSSRHLVKPQRERKSKSAQGQSNSRTPADTEMASHRSFKQAMSQPLALGQDKLFVM